MFSYPSRVHPSRVLLKTGATTKRTLSLHDSGPGIFTAPLETRTSPSSGALSAQFRLKYRCREAAHLLLLHAVGRVAGADNLRISVV